MNTKFYISRTMLLALLIVTGVNIQAQDTLAIFHMQFNDTLSDGTGNYTVFVHDPNAYGSEDAIPFNSENNPIEGTHSLDWGLLDTGSDEAGNLNNEAEFRLVDNGADSPVDIRTEENSSISGDDPRTVTAWIRKPDNVGANGTHAIINIGNGDATATVDPLGRCTFQLNSGANPKRLVLGLAGSAINFNYGDTDINLNDDAWHHVAFTYPGGELSNVKMYVDGAEVETDAAGNTEVMNTVEDRMTIGSRGDAAFALKWWSDGAMDDLRVYDYALSETEIGSVYAGGFLSISDIGFGDDELRAFPNAVVDILNIETTSFASLEINVFDMAGKGLIRTGGNSVDMSALLPGMYVVQVREGNKVANLKILKK